MTFVFVDWPRIVPPFQVWRKTDEEPLDHRPRGGCHGRLPLGHTGHRPDKYRYYKLLVHDDPAELQFVQYWLDHLQFGRQVDFCLRCSKLWCRPYLQIQHLRQHKRDWRMHSGWDSTHRSDMRGNCWRLCISSLHRYTSRLRYYKMHCKRRL